MAEKSMLPDFPGNHTKVTKVEQRKELGTEDQAILRLTNENAFQRNQIRAALHELSRRGIDCDGLSLTGSVNKVLCDFEVQTQKHYKAREKLKSLKRNAASSKNKELCDEIDKILECLG
jgi:hypothetical protein